MKVHPMRANPRTIKPVICNESESSPDEFALSAIALEDAKQIMENSNKTNVYTRIVTSPKHRNYLLDGHNKFAVLKNLSFSKRYNNR